MSNPLVSVVIPTYNRAGIIAQTIENIFRQTYRNFELIVVDDGSTDDTPAKLWHFGDRIRVITQANCGPIAARNRGAEAARGEIVAFQDSDDAWEPTKLARQVALLQRGGNSVPCCLCNADVGTINGKPRTSFDYSWIHPGREEGLWLNVGEVLASRFVLFNQCVAIRRATFERLGGFDESLKYLEDYDLPLRLALEGPWAFIREPLVIYSGTTAGSFSDQARRDPITLYNCGLAIFERTLAFLESSEQQVRMQGYMKRQMKSIRRQLRQIHLSRRGVWGARAAALLARTGRYQEALYRRSPWYPRMVTAPLDSALSH